MNDNGKGNENMSKIDSKTQTLDSTCLIIFGINYDFVNVFYCVFLDSKSVFAQGGNGGFGPRQACGGQGGLGRIRLEAEILKGALSQSAGVATTVMRKRQFVVSCQNVPKTRSFIVNCQKGIFVGMCKNVLERG